MTILTEAFYSVDDFLLFFFVPSSYNDWNKGRRERKRTKKKKIRYKNVNFFFGVLRLAMNHPPSLSSVACFDGTTQRFIYISLLGTSYVSDLFEDLVGNNALSSQRTVIDVLRFIYFYSFIYFLSFSGFVSRRCAHVG